MLDEKSLNQKARELFEGLHIKLDPRVRVSGLAVAQQQMVEIAKALSFSSDVLIMDEPTAALTDTEIDELFRIIRHLRERGTGIVHISHRLEELKQISDRVTVMRDGRYIDTVPTAGTGIQSIISAGQMLKLGESEMAIAGGMENMSQAPHILRGGRDGLRFGADTKLEDSLFEALAEVSAAFSDQDYLRSFSRICDLRKELRFGLSERAFPEQRLLLYGLDCLLEEMAYVAVRHVASQYEEQGVDLPQCLRVIRACALNLTHDGLHSRQLLDLVGMLTDGSHSYAELTNVLHQIRRAPDLGGDHRQAAAHVLDHGIGEPLGVGAEHADVQVLEQGNGVAAREHGVDGVRQAAPRRALDEGFAGLDGQHDTVL